MACSLAARRSLAFVASALFVVVAGCSGGGSGGGPFFPGGGGGGGNPTPTPTAAPTAVPTNCATGTPAPATGPAAFYLNASCSTANTEFGYTIPADANGTVVVGSTSDQSEPLAANSVQSPPPADSFAVDVSAGETPASARRIRPRAMTAGVLRAPAVVRFGRHVAHVRAIPNRKLASLLLASSRAASAPRKRSILPTTLGSTTGIWTLNASQTYIQVPSTLEYAGAHGDIWVDNTLLAANGGPLSATAVQSIGADYDNAWNAKLGTPDYSSSSTGAQEGTQCIDGQTTVPIFIPDPDDRQAVFVISSASNGGFGSYFDPANLIYQNVATACLGAESNERSGIYVQYDVGNSGNPQSQQLAEDDVVLTANGLTHLVDFVGHTITNPGSNDNATFLTTGYIDTPFIIEGLASLSQDFAVTAKYPQLAYDVDDNLQAAQTYLAAPQNYELTAFFGSDPNAGPAAGCNGCFGSAYLFARYAYDRFGSNYPNAIVNSGLTGFSNLQNAFGTATSPQNVVGDFAVAMAASGQGVTTDPRFNVTGFTTYGTFTDQFGNSLTLGGPVAAATQAVGTDVSYPTRDGAFTYVTLGGLPASATVAVSAGSSAFGLAAALDQH